MKKIISVLIFTFFVIVGFSQSYEDCKAKSYTSEELVYFRRELKFIPKYTLVGNFDNVLEGIPKEIQDQYAVEIAMDCFKKKNILIENMYNFWDYRISQKALNDNFALYCIFYRFDKVAKNVYKSQFKLYPSEKN